MKTEIVSRQQLYELMWSEPISSILKRYHTSYHHLRRTCARMNIPIPGAAYWIKKRYGTQPAPIPLSGEYVGEQEVTLNLIPENVDPKQLSLSPVEIRQQEIEADPLVHLTIPAKLTFSDKVVQRAQKGFAERLKDKYGGDMIGPGWEDQFHCIVSKGNIDRSLLIMDTFVKALRARGHNLEIGRETKAIVDGQGIIISIIEPSLRTMIEGDFYKRQELKPSGKLAFRMKKHFQTKQFVDGKKTVEQQLSRILAELELHGAELKVEAIEWEKRRVIQKKEEEIRREAQERRDKEVKRLKRLIRLAHRSAQTEELRRYIDRVEAQAILGNSMTAEQTEWISWARAKADWLDPIVEANDDLLAEVDQDRFLRKEESSFSP